MYVDDIDQSYTRVCVTIVFGGSSKPSSFQPEPEPNTEEREREILRAVGLNPSHG